MASRLPLPVSVRANAGLAGWLALAAGFALGGLVEAIAEDAGAAAVLASLAMAAAMAFTWWRPLTAVAGMAAICGLQAAAGDPLYDLTVALYTIPAALIMLAARSDGRVLALGLLFGAAMFAFVLGPEEDIPLGDIVFAAAIMLALPALVGRSFRSRSQLNTELRERAKRLAGDREARAQEAAAAERRRIAGELHDLVAHGVSGMVVQAGAARRLVASDDPRAPDAILAIEEGGREALDELRRLLGVLRRGDADLALAPQPSLARIGALVAQLRESGRDVQLTVEGEHGPISPGVDVAGYRVVEEALRGGVAEPARVIVSYGSHHVDVAVIGASPAAADLVGLRERVKLFGGELVTARRGGSPALRAHLPLAGGTA